MSGRGVSNVKGAATARTARGWTAGLVAASASIAIFAFAAFPSFAAAFAPIVLSPSATPAMTGAQLNATVYPYGLDTHYHFEYGTTTAYGTSVPIPDGDAGSTAYPGTVQVPQAVAGLTPNTTYHFRLLASNLDGTTPSGDQTFTTLGNPPAVVASSASPIAGGFNLSGTVNPHGADAKFRFEYGTTTSYGTKVPVPDGDAGSGSAAVAVSQDLTVLLPNTTYHFRLVAQNSGGSSPSPDQEFTTPPSPPGAPSAVVNPPEAITAGYRLKGAINPNSVETEYHFEFGTTTGYGQLLPAPDVGIGAGSTAVAVFQDVAALLPNTTYHYRLVAHNVDGTTPSLDQAFTTPPDPPEVVATAFGEAAGGYLLNGTVDPNGGDTTYHFQFGFTTAYGSNVPAADLDAGSGTHPVPVSQSVEGLPPNVVYHYRLVAKNAGGTTLSGDQEFITPPAAGTVVDPPPQMLSTPPLQPPSSAPALSRPPSPTNRLTVKLAAAKGSAPSLRVSVPGPGTLAAAGKQLKAVRVSSHAAGAVTLKLKLTGAGLEALGRARSHRLAVKVTITFTPAGGSAGTVSKTVIFKQ